MLVEIIAIIFITLAFGFLFFYAFGITGPWDSLWAFILILFLSIFLFMIWVTPIGPVWWGVAWIDLLIIGLIFALLLAAASPSGKSLKRRETTIEKAGRNEEAVVIGAFFWILILITLVAITAVVFLKSTP